MFFSLCVNCYVVVAATCSCGEDATRVARESTETCGVSKANQCFAGGMWKSKIYPYFLDLFNMIIIRI